MNYTNRVVTVRAPVNIAVIKYWGKIDETEIIPLNNSISATLHVDDLCAKTTIKLNPDSNEDSFWLNNEKQVIADNKRLVRCLEAIRSIKKESAKYGLQIHSNNNFPTAAGLASSAAGYACLVSALAALFDITDKKMISILARQGSGSACRSIYGGFVEWLAGTDSSSSFAKQIVTETAWPEMRIIILVINDEAKEVPSTSGMKRSVETSQLLKYRAKHIVPVRCDAMRQAIMDKNFHDFAEITMMDSNQFHAICLDTYAPIFYLNEASKAIINFVHQFNNYYSTNKLAYTFDAGPNACLFMEENTRPQVLQLLNIFFPTAGIKFTDANDSLDSNLQQVLSLKVKKLPNIIREVIQTRLGPGPEVIQTF